MTDDARRSALTVWTCPGGDVRISARNPTWVGHECPKKKNALTTFKKESNGTGK